MKTDKKAVLVRFDADFVEKIDRMAEDLKIPRERAIKNLCDVGLDDYAIASKLGLASVAAFVRKNNITLTAQL